MRAPRACIASSGAAGVAELERRGSVGARSAQLELNDLQLIKIRQPTLTSRILRRWIGGKVLIRRGGSLPSTASGGGPQTAVSSTSAPEPTPSACAAIPGRQPLAQISRVLAFSSSRLSFQSVKHFCRSSLMSSAPGKSEYLENKAAMVVSCCGPGSP